MSDALSRFLRERAAQLRPITRSRLAEQMLLVSKR
jgi:hypothetical protein